MPLVIFDCDGVLVDSEPIAMAVLLETVAKAGYALEEDRAYRLFLGKSLQQEARMLREELGMEIDLAALQQVQPYLLQRLRSELEPLPGVLEVVDGLKGQCCVASSSEPDRIRMSLSVTGLLEAFEPHIFSASAVRNGKPAPDLFLYAASTMGVTPGECVVVEDSPAGIVAAKRAGMRVFAFLGGSHARFAELHEQVGAENPDAVFSHMRELPDLLAAPRVAMT